MRQASVKQSSLSIISKKFMDHSKCNGSGFFSMDSKIGSGRPASRKHFLISEMAWKSTHQNPISDLVAAKRFRDAASLAWSSVVVLDSSIMSERTTTTTFDLPLRTGSKSVT